MFLGMKFGAIGTIAVIATAATVILSFFSGKISVKEILSYLF
jgi:hypothetical protein